MLPKTQQWHVAQAAQQGQEQTSRVARSPRRTQASQSQPRASSPKARRRGGRAEGGLGFGLHHVLLQSMRQAASLRDFQHWLRRTDNADPREETK